MATAYHSTGIPDITVFFEASPQLERFAQLGPVMRWIMGCGPVQQILKSAIDRQPEGPSDDERAAGRSVLLGIAEDAQGNRVTSRLTTPEGYTLTAQTSLKIVEKVLAGEAVPGFQTPSSAFGPDFITSFDDCKLDDLNH